MSIIDATICHAIIHRNTWANPCGRMMLYVTIPDMTYSPISDSHMNRHDIAVNLSSFSILSMFEKKIISLYFVVLLYITPHLLL